jgi:hypothetical protein
MHPEEFSAEGASAISQTGKVIDEKSETRGYANPVHVHLIGSEIRRRRKQKYIDRKREKSPR